jgi:hypothetical protein
MRGITQLGGAAALAMVILALTPAAQAGPTSHLDRISCSRLFSPTANGRTVNVTGVWAGNDGGSYWVRQLGSCVYWAGFSGSGNSPSIGTSFSNVFAGWLSTSSGIRIYGYWADVPRGATASGGTITVDVAIDGSGRGLTMNKFSSTGGFGGTAWKRIS